MEAIRFENITKTFGNTVANKNISFSLEEGKIYSLLGENGSGKTSLMNIIAGIYKQDTGKVYIHGNEVNINSPRDAFRHKIGMIHQHFKLVDVFSASENVVLGLTKDDNKLFYQDQLQKGLKHIHEAENNPDLTDEERKEEIRRYKRYIRRSKHFNIAGASERIENICAKYGFKIDPNQKVYDMTVSQKQTLEIVKALYRGVDILILDEPTAVLTPQETETLFDVLRNMRKAGKTVIIITHKLNEVMEISDEVVILRKGEYIATVDTNKTNEKQLTDMMVGRKINLQIKRPTPKNVQDRLIINNLTCRNADGNIAVDNVSFTIRSGEILGVAGISGSGQKELLDAIAGLNKYESGDMIFHNPKKEQPVTFYHKDIKQIKELAEKGAFHNKKGEKINLTGVNNATITKMVNEGDIIFYEDEIINLKHKTPLEIRDLGIKLSFVPEDRLGMGLVGSMDLTDNMMLRSYRKGSGIFLNRKKPQDLADKIVDELEVVTPSTHTQVSKLSGGNIQKVLVGREISSSPKVFMAAYPVRGLDINSSYLIYDLLNEQKVRGAAVLFVGEDLDVLMSLCDRVLVLSEGKISGIIDPRVTSKEQVGLLMTKGASK